VLISWRAHANSVFDRPDFQRAAQEYEQLAANYPTSPDVNDFKLMQARALLNQLKLPGAQALLQVIPLPEKRESPRDRSLFRTKLLIEAKSGVTADQLVELSAVWGERSTPSATGATGGISDIWAPTKIETSQLNEARDKIIAQWLETAGSRRNKQGLADLERIIGIDPENVDAWLAKADVHLELGQTPQAMEAMERRGKLAGDAESIEIRQREGVLKAIYDLTRASKDNKVAAAALANVPSLLSNPQLADRRMLLAAAVSTLGGDDAFLPQAVAALRPSGETMPELKGQFAELLKRDIARRLYVEQDFAGAAKQLLKDCDFVAKNLKTEPIPELVRACRAECMLALHIPGAADALGTNGESPYYHYIKARVLADSGSAPQMIKDSLKQLFARPKPVFAPGSERNAQAIKMVDGIADEVRPAAAFKIETLLRQPIVASPAARETFEILKNAYRWASPPALSQKSQANLAIAAWWLKPGPDDPALAQTISKEVADAWLKESVISGDDRPLAFSLFHTFLLAHAGTQDQNVERLKVDAAQELIELASKTDLDVKDAAAFNNAVLAPVEPLASRQRSHKFFADAAGLIAKNANLNWGFAPIDNRPVSVSEKLDELYSEAIEASGRKVGEYFKARADLRALRQPPDHVGILADAGELKKFKNYVGQGFALEGYVHFLQSREQQGSVEKRYEKLQLALKSLVEAEKYSTTLAKADQDQVSYFRSLIHTERGNLAGLADPAEKVVPRDEFEKAIKYAEKVIANGGGPSLQYAYEAAANAYEDLAWHARVAPVENFKKAIDHLTNSVAVNRASPTAHMALARSYYKMIVEAGVNRKLSRESLGKAQQELRDAIELAGEGKNAEAHLWLGKVIQAMHVDEQTSLEEAQKLLTAEEYKQADDQFNKAFLAAKEANFGPVFLATYAYARAEHALFNPAINSAREGSRHLVIGPVHSRADQLAELKQARTVRMDPVQEAKILRATADLLASPSDPKMPVKVLEQLENAAIAITKVPEDELTRSDVKLMEFRLGLQSKLRPDQLASPAIVRSAVQDAIWYSRAPRPLAWKDRLQGLQTALRLSQQMAIKSSAYVEAAAGDQSKTLQRIIDVKLPPEYDFKRHLEIVNICITALREANSPAMVNIHRELRQVTRAYLQDVLSEARRLKRPSTETAALDKFLAAVPP
jgi:hypothetical protein